MRSVVLGITISSLIILGCNQSGMGTFHSIRNEVALQDTALENDITILSISVLTDAYYVVTGELQYRDSAITDPTLFVWESRDLPADTALLTSAAVLADELYATATDLIMETIDGSVGSYLYKLDESDGTWTLIDLGVETANDRVVAVSAYSAGLMVTTSVDDYSYLSFITADGSAFTELTLPFSTVAPRRIVEYAGALWVIAGNTLFTGSASSLSAVSDANSPGSASPAENSLVDIRHYPDISALLVLAADGTLYAYTGSAWLSLGTDPEIPGIEVLMDSTSIQATRLFGAEVAGEQVIIIGTKSGYLEIVLPTAALDAAAFDAIVVEEPGENSASTSGTDYSIIDLSSAAILDFEIDGTLLFVATAGAGLWRNDLSADLIWSRE